MKTIVTIVLMAVFALQSQAQEIRQKEYSDSTGSYLVQYQIDPDRPLFESDSVQHYEAVITVFAVEEIDTVQVYQPLRGVYADRPCACDKPAKIVERHLELKQAEQ